MLINIYLGTMGWKWVGSELRASEVFLMTSSFSQGKLILVSQPPAKGGSQHVAASVFFTGAVEV